jgi:hypothetical protein
MSWFAKKKRKLTPYEVILKYLELSVSDEKNSNDYNKILDDNFKYYNKSNGSNIAVNKDIIINNINSPFINMNELNNKVTEMNIKKIDWKTFKIIVTGYGLSIHPTFKFIKRSELKIEETIQINEDLDTTTISSINSHKVSLFLCFIK